MLLNRNQINDSIKLKKMGQNDHILLHNNYQLGLYAHCRNKQCIFIPLGVSRNSEILRQFIPLGKRGQFKCLEYNLWNLDIYMHKMCR